MLKKLTLAGAFALATITSVQAQDTSNLTTAIEAAQSAGLADTLASSDGITVFVPTNDAIAGLPADALQGLLGDQEKLASTITYYAIPGKVMAADVAGLLESGPATVKTVNGGELTISKEGDDITIAGAQGSAKVVSTDITAGNVVIHVIDGAFLPAS